MDFLDSLDLDTKDKKCHRVQSWYLYEQYKALERQQIDVAQKLKNRSYQDNILRQELTERRARRKLYDQFGLCQSESRIQKRINSNTGQAKTLSVSNDEFFESFSEQDDERVTQETEFDDVYSQELSTTKCFMGVFNSTDEQKDDMSCAGSANNMSYPESVNSVVENNAPNDGCDHLKCTKEETQFTTVIIAQDINKQLDVVKQNIQCLENITQFQDDDDNKSSENNYECLADDLQKIKNNSLGAKGQKDYYSIIPIWSRLVSFAYQLVQLNHGNCYCDYSSQFLTAVLACDVLRRGVNRMCNILQPYVSPIKFTTDESEMSDCCHKTVKMKKSVQSRKSRKTFEKKLRRRSKCSDKYSRHAQRNYSENCCCYRRSSLEYRTKPKKPRRGSEPWRSVANVENSKDMFSSSSSSIRPQMSKENMSKSMFKGCSCYKKAVNPMLKIAQYIDSILKDMDES